MLWWTWYEWMIRLVHRHVISIMYWLEMMMVVWIGMVVSVPTTVGDMVHNNVVRMFHIRSRFCDCQY